MWLNKRPIGMWFACVVYWTLNKHTSEKEWEWQTEQINCKHTDRSRMTISRDKR